MLKIVAAFISGVGMIAAFLGLWPDELHLDELTVTPSKYDVKILRDSWGVPHIFGVTDADAAYGLAYAHSEDDFSTIQRGMLAVRGRMASVFGKDSAPMDYFVHLLRIWDVINAKYETDLSAEVRALCEAYADGLNHYAKLHQDEALPNLFPVTGKDVVAGFVLKTPLFFGLHTVLKELFEPERKQEISTRIVASNTQMQIDWSGAIGSNTFGVSPRRSSDGQTMLAINSHQPWEGPLAWYEVHLHSEEGWDMVGGVFPGSPLPLHGHNRELGWALTINKPDLVDVYLLEMNPEDPNQYRFDGEWLDLDARTIEIEVKLFGLIQWTVERETYWSIHGPVVKQPHGTYAIRYAGYGDIRQVEQWFRMNKARNFDEWQDAMRMLSIPKFNCGYADAEGNIYYVYNALLPKRSEGYDWSQYLPGDTSETLWTEYFPFEQLPQVKNPASGFLQNCNSSPFRTTTGPGNPDPDDFPGTMYIETRMSNRALRALELFGADSSITEKEFCQYKYDMAYSKKSNLAKYVRKILAAEVPEHPVAAEALEVLKGWDLKTNPDNTGTALGVVTIKAFVQSKKDPDDLDGLMSIFLEVAQNLKKNFGRIDEPWKNVNRLIHGDLDLGMGGGPDILHAVYGEQMDDGRQQGKVGDSYILLATWDKNGKVKSRSIHQFGSATTRENSQHYADQSFLFVERKLKPVWMDKADILSNLEREYRPGEEVR